MSVELHDWIAEGMSNCCCAAVDDPSGKNEYGRCMACHEMCGIITDAQAECMGTDEHRKRVISEGGYDVCFNCGGKE